MGKTALAAEVVARLSDDTQSFPAGAAWVSCGGLTGAEGLAEVWTRVARAIGVEQVATLPDAEARQAALRNALTRGERLLLALDNIDGIEAGPGPILETLAVQGHTTLQLTARQAADAQGVTPISLDILPTEEAEALFAQALARSTREPRPTPAAQAALPGLVEALSTITQCLRE